MPRVAATQPPGPKRAAPRNPPRNPRLIAERPSKSDIRRRQLAKLAGPLALLLGFAAAGLLVYGITKSADPNGALGQVRTELGAATGLKITHITVPNQKQTPQALIDAALGPALGTSLLNYPLEPARQRLLQIPWISAATVERRLPDTLVIDITEHDAFAIWQDQGKFVLIDRKGNPLPDVDVVNFKQLPLVVGAGAPQAAQALLTALAAQPSIQKLVTAAVRVGNRRWDLYLSNNTEVLLPQDQEPAALNRLAALEAQDLLFERPLAAIDLRQPDKLIIRLRDAPAAAAVGSADPSKSNQAKADTAAKPAVNSPAGGKAVP